MPRGKPLLPRIPVAVQRYGLAVLSVAIALGTALFLQLFSLRGVEFPLFLFAIALTVCTQAQGLGSSQLSFQV